jgi:flagellar motor switch protein FliN
MALLPHSPAVASKPADLQRLLQIRVPVIVKLAERRISVRDVLQLSTGSIIEFYKSSDEELELLINNRTIGVGVAVKVGENFGLKLTRVGTPRQLIEALGQD